MVNTKQQADYEIANAQKYISMKVPGHSPSLFAYPWGEGNDFLTKQYFPAQASAMGVKACFTTAGRAVRKSDNRWELPRFVFGEHWKSKKSLLCLLEN